MLQLCIKLQVLDVVTLALGGGRGLRGDRADASVLREARAVRPPVRQQHGEREASTLYIPPN